MGIIPKQFIHVKAFAVCTGLYLASSKRDKTKRILAEFKTKNKI